MDASSYSRYRYQVFWVLGVAACFVVYGAHWAFNNQSNSIVEWLPAEFEETQRLMEFASQFGSEEFLMVSWEGCTLEDPRLAELARQLRQPPRVDGQAGEPFFAPVMSGAEILDDLMSPPLDLRRSTALQRLEGVLIGKDGETTCIVMALANPATVDRHQAVGFVFDCADSVDGLSRETIYLAGSIADSVAIDEASQNSLTILTITALVVVFALACISFRHLSLAVMAFVVALYNQQLTLALVHFTGWHLDSVLLMAPPLVFVLSMSACVHLVNYYGDAVREQGMPGAPWRAVLAGFSPCLLASLTTALGLLSLQSSYLIPLRRFGAYSAAGVLLGTAVLFLLLPACLETWPARRWRAARPAKDADRQGNRGDRRADRAWDGLTELVRLGQFPILLATLGLLVTSHIGLQKTKGTAFLHDMFSPDARIVRDYNWLETHVGPLVPVEIVLRLPKFEASIPTYATPMLARMKWVAWMQGVIRQVEDVEATVSVVNFAPSFPRDQLVGFRPAERARRTAIEKNLRNRRQEFERLGYLRETADELFFEISGHVNAGRRADYETVMRELRAGIEPVLEAAQREFPESSVSVSGGVPLVQKTQVQLVKDLKNSMTVAFGLIAVVMVAMMWRILLRDALGTASWLTVVGLLLKGVAAGLLVMIPNVLPCLGVFGMMGWLNIDVEIGTVMTATAAMGIAVDDTLHFVTWFRRGLASGETQRGAVGFAYHRCGTAMVQTSLICGLGLLVFVASPFGPTSRFGWLMFVMLLTALLADLIVLPAILISPLGRLFTFQADVNRTSDVPATG